MLRITKGPPPDCIAVLHRTPGATWASVSGEQKDAMRKALLAEQGHLCAYCMRRIENDRARCGVEHWRPRSDPATDPFDWHDLLAVCDGNTGATHSEQHCDKHRGDAPLTLHPAHAQVNVEERVAYHLDGRIDCADAGPLNLNYHRLRQGRRAIQDALKSRCASLDATTLRRLLSDWTSADAQGRRKEYAGVAIAFLRRRLAHVEERARRMRSNRDR